MANTLEDHITEVLESFKGEEINRVIAIYKPPDLELAIFYSKIISKLSPIIGNLLERSVAEELGVRLKAPYKRQDPEFPDVVVELGKDKRIGFEIKAWYALSTEAAARFRTSQKELSSGAYEEVYLVVIAWTMSKLFYGKPKIINLFFEKAIEIARTRDQKYHNPPWNIVLEPVDTSARTINLQQKVVIGKKLQEESLPEGVQAEEELKKLAQDKKIKDYKVYSTQEDYVDFIRNLERVLPYREDSNFGKIDRIPHERLSSFLKNTKKLKLLGLTLKDWIEVMEYISKRSSQEEKSAQKSKKKKKLEDLVEKALKKLGYPNTY